MQRIRITPERLARFDIAKIAIVVVAASALAVTMAVSAPTNTQVAGPAAAAKQVSHALKQPAKPKVSKNSNNKYGAGTASSNSNDFGAGTVGSAPAGSIEAPSYINADCHGDVSEALQTWLQGLPSGTIWYSPVGSCYLINHGINLLFPHGITIDGGVFVERWLGYMSRRGFNVIGGTDMKFESMTINGPNVNNIWDPQRAFQGGIELQGTAGATISNVRITHVFGDGITLAPLRGSADHNSGRIIRPVTGLTIDKVWIDGAGRQGISPVSVTNATITDVTMHNVDMNGFDFEADQGNEGAINVTINGCNMVNVGSLANISENAGFTGPITIENCNMATLDGGTAVYVRSVSDSTENGPVVFTNDNVRCQTRAPVACFQLLNAQDFTVSNSNVTFGPGDVSIATEAVYTASVKTHANFDDDVVTGYGNRGLVWAHSTVTVTGGTWTRR
jgi:hypothetical protein